MVRRRLLSLRPLAAAAAGWLAAPPVPVLLTSVVLRPVWLACAICVLANPAAAETSPLSLQSLDPITLQDHRVQTPGDPRLLGEPEIAGLAVQRAWTATLLQRQSQLLAAQAAAGRHGSTPAGSLSAIFLRGQAARQRGDAVAQALQGHYALRMLLEQATLLEASLQTADQLQQRIERTIELGLMTPADESLWQAQSTRFELNDRKAEVQGRISEIRQQMAATLQADWLCDYRPADALEPKLPPGDCAQWCRDALAQRADYLAWQQIRCRMDASSLPEVQRLVGQLIPSWTAGAGQPTSWLHHLPIRLASRRGSELGQLQSQLSAALQGLGNQICSDVQAAATQLETALARAGLAQQQIAPIDQQLQRLSELEQIGQPDAAAKTRWVLRRQQAQLQRLARLGEAKQAELEMRRLMGFWDQ